MPRLALLLLLLPIIAAPASVTAVEVADENLFVTNQGGLGPTGLIRIDGLTGEQSLVSSGGVFSEPRGVVFDATGQLLVTDQAARVLVRVDPATGSQVLVASGLGDSPFGLAVDPVGQIIVTDRVGGGPVFRVDPLAGATTVVSAGGLLAVPYGLVIDAAGNYVVVDGEAFGGSGGLIRIDPVTGAQSVISSGGLFVEPFALAIDAAGNYIVSDRNAFGGTGGIIRVDPLSGLQSAVSFGGFFVDGPSGIVLGATGQIFTVDNLLGGLFSIDPTTGAQTVISSGGLLSGPVGVALGPPRRVPEPPTLALTLSGLLIGFAVVRLQARRRTVHGAVRG